MIEREDHEGVTVVRLAHGKASALDLELCTAIAETFDSLHDAAAVVLTGTGSIFSAGVDLHRLVREGEDYVRRFLPALGRAIESLVRLDRPLVAAINGHAIAGGCILAAACDVRIMVDGRGRIGVPELLVGVPFPAVGEAVMRAAIAPHALREVLLTGGTWTAPEALQRGLIDRIAGDSAPLDEALGLGATMARIDRKLFAEAKRKLLAEVRDVAARGESEEVFAAWTSAEGLQRVRNYVEQTLRKG